MKKRIALAFALRAALAVSAQEADIDALFESPQADIVEPDGTKQVDHRDAFETSEKLLFSGRVEAVGGAALGWMAPLDSPDFASSWDWTPYADASAYLYFDARPDRSFHLHGSLLMSTDPTAGSFNWSAPSVDELYLDYTPVNAATTRVGTFTTTWGQGRLYTPGNLMDGSDKGLSLRMTFPTVLSGLSFIALAQKSFFTNPESPSYAEIEYGALVDHVIGPVRLSAGARYRKAGNEATVLSKGLKLLGSIKTTLLKTDFLCDFVYENPEETPIALFGFFREWDRLKLYGEYESDGKAGLAFVLTQGLGTKLDFGVKWLHTVATTSGAVAAGISFSPWNHSKVQVAVPIQYGDGAADIFDSDYPITQKIGLILLFRVSASF